MLSALIWETVFGLAWIKFFSETFAKADGVRIDLVRNSSESVHIRYGG